MKRSRYREVDDLIPTSPMADIAFLLIIFFMITVTFSTSKGLDLGLPEDEEPREVDLVESVLVEVLPDGGLRVDRKPMALAGLLPYLAPKLERDPQKPVILQPHPQATYGAMIGVYDELRQGKEKLGLREAIRIALPTQREAQRWWR